MSLNLSVPRRDTPTLSRHRHMRLVAAAPSLWRVMDRAGRVVGHLKVIGEGTERRYSARRYHPPSRSFRELGIFWSSDDAVECLAFAS